MSELDKRAERIMNETVGIAKGIGFLGLFTVLGYKFGTDVLAPATPGPEWVQPIIVGASTAGGAGLGSIFAVSAFPGEGPAGKLDDGSKSKASSNKPKKEKEVEKIHIPMGRRIAGSAVAGLTTLAGGAVGRLIGWGAESVLPAAQEAGTANLGTVLGLGLGAVAGSIEYVMISDQESERIAPEKPPPTEKVYGPEFWKHMWPDFRAAHDIHDFDPDLPTDWIAYEDPNGLFTTPKA